MSRLASVILLAGFLGTAWCAVTLTLTSHKGHPAGLLIVSGLAALAATGFAAWALAGVLPVPLRQRRAQHQHSAETRLDRRIG